MFSVTMSAWRAVSDGGISIEKVESRVTVAGVDLAAVAVVKPAYWMSLEDGRQNSKNALDRALRRRDAD